MDKITKQSIRNTRKELAKYKKQISITENKEVSFIFREKDRYELEKLVGKLED